MDLKELQEILWNVGISNIRTTAHGFKRTQDKKRRISLPLVIHHLCNPSNLYFFEEREARENNEQKFKLIFKINRIFDLVVVIVIKEEDLNTRKVYIITAYKVVRKLQKKLQKQNMIKM